MIEKLKNVFFSKVAKNGFWLLVLQGVNTVAPLLTIPYVTRVLSKSAYGVFSLALSWIGYFQVIVEYGFTLSGAKKTAVAKSESEYSAIHSNIFILRLLLALTSFVLLQAMLIIFPFSNTQKISMLLLFLMVIAVVFQQTWFYQGIMEMKFIAIINVIGRLVSIILIFAFVKDENDVYLYSFFYSVNSFRHAI